MALKVRKVDVVAVRPRMIVAHYSDNRVAVVDTGMQPAVRVVVGKALGRTDGAVEVLGVGGGAPVYANLRGASGAQSAKSPWTTASCGQSVKSRFEALAYTAPPSSSE